MPRKRRIQKRKKNQGKRKYRDKREKPTQGSEGTRIRNKLSDETKRMLEELKKKREQEPVRQAEKKPVQKQKQVKKRQEKQKPLKPKTDRKPLSEAEKRFLRETLIKKVSAEVVMIGRPGKAKYYTLQGFRSLLERGEKFSSKFNETLYKEFLRFKQLTGGTFKEFQDLVERILV